MKKILAILILLLLLPANVFAASISLQNGKTSLGSTDEYSVDVNLSIQSADDTQYYLRGVFYKSGTKNYCGYTWNGNSWFQGPYTTSEGWKNFLPVVVKNNTWTGQIKAKLDLDDSGCADSGSYFFKVERFTQTGSGIYDSQNELSIAVTLPSPTPSPFPTVKPTATPTQVKVTVTKYISQLVTPSPTIKVVTPTISPIGTITTSSSAMVLYSSTSSLITSPDPTITLIADKKSREVLSASYIMISGGVMLIISCGILAWHRYIRKKA